MGSPLGNLKLESDNHGLFHLAFTKEKKTSIKDQFLYKAKTQLESYFSGNLTKFSIKLSLKGTAFEKKVWRYILKHVPHGKHTTYSALAKAIGHPKSYRAVGNALGKNPIPIIVPCHRVLRETKKLGGYSSGIQKKKFLLNLEGIRFITSMPKFQKHSNYRQKNYNKYG